MARKKNHSLSRSKLYNITIITAFIFFSLTIVTISILKKPQSDPDVKAFTTSNALAQAPDVKPGDCNGDGKIDAGDMSALSLEIFDGDGDRVEAVASGSFTGTSGCDSNSDGLVDAGDMSCLNLLMFGNICNPMAVTPTPVPTATPQQSTPVPPTITPRPTATIRPTFTPRPTATPTMTIIPFPTVASPTPRPVSDTGIAGDCNGDKRVDAGDISALNLEIWDKDGNKAIDTPFGSFIGTPSCDVNYDGAVDAGDLVCLPQVLFGNKSCSVPYLKSRYYSHDQEAILFAKGYPKSISFTGLSNSGPTDRGIRWRIVNGFQMLGYERYGLPLNKAFIPVDMVKLDNDLAGMEKTIYETAASFPNWEQYTVHDFKHNLPQAYAMYTYASINDLFNSGNTQLIVPTERCLTTSLTPHLCGNFVTGSNPSGMNCKGNTQRLVQLPFRLQFGQLFGFAGTPQISRTAYPPVAISSNYDFVSGFIHEFVHEVDKNIQNQIVTVGGIKTSAYMRKEHCMDTYMDFYQPGSPFLQKFTNGTQQLKDFVSAYAAGLSNPNKDYRPAEDAAESVTAYLLLPEFFRSRMKNSTLLQQRYNYLKQHVFAGKEFTNPYLNPDAEYVVSATGHTGKFNQENTIQRFVVSDIHPL